MIDWLERHQAPCIYKHFLGIDCPTCGFQTAFILLLKGNLIDSLKLYPALIPTLILISLLISNFLFRKPGWKIVKWFAITDLAVIFGSYFIKMVL
jgi:hypothetical protein